MTWSTPSVNHRASTYLQAHSHICSFQRANLEFPILLTYMPLNMQVWIAAFYNVYLLTRRFITYNIKTQIIKLCYSTVPQSKVKMSTETLLWLESTGSARLSVCEVLWWCCHDTPVHSSWPPVKHCAAPHCEQQQLEEGRERVRRGEGCSHASSFPL